MKDTGVAYLCWAIGFVGFCGIHRFYLERPGTGCLWFATGGFCVIGQVIDMFLIPGMVREINKQHRKDNQPVPQTIIIQMEGGKKKKKRKPSVEEYDADAPDPFADLN